MPVRILLYVSTLIYYLRIGSLYLGITIAYDLVRLITFTGS
jgi:hypothetical protein